MRHNSHLQFHVRRQALGHSIRSITDRMPVIPRTDVVDGEEVINPAILPFSQGLDGVDITTDRLLVTALYWSIFVVLVVFLILRIAQISNSHLRHLFSLTADTRQQNYWSFDRTSFWPNLKKHLIYAPLGRKRHNREIQISKAMNVGTVPSRFQTLILFIYLVSNIAYCCILDFRNDNKAKLFASARGRTGIMATVNMIPLVLFAGRNNPLITLLRISFDTYNMMHRWIGRVIIIEAIAHTLFWGVNAFNARGPGMAMERVWKDNFLCAGAVGTVAMTIIIIQACSVIRHAFYETFLALHQFLALLAVLGVYFHLEMANLPALPYIRIVVGLWAFDRVFRFGRLVYLNISRRGCTNVEVKALKGDACRVTFNLPRQVKITPGSHVYAYIPRISGWMCHPFSVAWTNADSEPSTGLRPLSPTTPSSVEKSSRSESRFSSYESSSSKTNTSVSLIVQAQSGFTRKLFDKACQAPNNTLHLTGLVEGPYATPSSSLHSYGTVILFAGGAGITHHLIQIRHLIASAQAGTVATRRIVLVWTVRTVDQLAWVQPWMDEILNMEGRRDVLRIKLFVTKPRNPGDIRQASTTVQMVAGRCRPGIVLDAEIPNRVGATAVSVCGPGAFEDEVRHAVRERLDQGTLDLFCESFSW